MLINSVKYFTLIDQIGEAPNPVYLPCLFAGLLTLSVVDVIKGLSQASQPGGIDDGWQDGVALLIELQALLGGQLCSWQTTLYQLRVHGQREVRDELFPEPTRSASLSWLAPGTIFLFVSTLPE